MSRSIALLSLLFLWLSLVSAAQQSTITGQITDSDGAAIANARILVHWDSSGSTVGLRDNVGISRDVIVATDTSGRYSANVPAGFYDVFVSAMAFTPTATKVRVKEGHPATFSTKLDVDLLVSKELGDQIYPAPK